MVLEKTSAAIGVAIYHIARRGKPIVNLTLPYNVDIIELFVSNLTQNTQNAH